MNQEPLAVNNRLINELLGDMFLALCIMYYVKNKGCQGFPKSQNPNISQNAIN